MKNMIIISVEDN